MVNQAQKMILIFGISTMLVLGIWYLVYLVGVM